MKPTNKPREEWEEIRERVFDILVMADGSGMDKTGHTNKIMDLLSHQISLAISQAKEKILKDLLAKLKEMI